MRRAAVSVPANIAEGFRRRGKGDNARFMNLAEGSLAEGGYYLIPAQDLGYGDSSKMAGEQAACGIGVSREGGFDGGVLAADICGAKQGIEAWAGGAGEGEDGAEVFFEMLRLVGSSTDGGEIEIDERIEFHGESRVVNQVEEAIQILGIPGQRENNAAADDGPNRRRGGNGPGVSDKIGRAGGSGFVLRDGGAEGIGRAGDREVGRDHGRARGRLAKVAAGDEDELSAIPID